MWRMYNILVIYIDRIYCKYYLPPASFYCVDISRVDTPGQVAVRCVQPADDLV